MRVDTKKTVMVFVEQNDGRIADASLELVCEASRLAANYPCCVDVSNLPKRGKLRNVDFAIVDGETFDGKPTRSRTVRQRQDPRKHTDPAWGERIFAQAVREVVREVRKTL